MERLPQLVRFLLLGGLAAAVNWLARIPLSVFLPFDMAVALAYLIGMSAGFTLYRKYVFPGASRPLIEQVLVFLGVNLAGAAVVLGLSRLFLDMPFGIGLPPLLRESVAHGFAIGIGAVVNFLGHKLLTFRPAGSGADA
ncbi:GtrA family protein [Devosia sp. YIM 151766]|uniref:GtrA family protein n=1 Tax=Devosia sp. YIM 151766 TaxID=3017325 RepID=UPI00255D054C|nr:GtrA family protein [Devosia sp. YIM 151766]WIY53945.1 GtrA family protein [Devosia sp. YIM 151766]